MTVFKASCTLLLCLALVGPSAVTAQENQAEAPGPRKGQLHRPLDGGKVLYRFGVRPAPGARGRVRHTGLTLVAASGRSVRAVDSGTVAIVAPIQGYGLTIIVDHGHGYHTLYAHLRSALVEPGASVQRGEPIGVIGATGSLEGEKLYFELRRGGEAIDPAGWFAPRGQRGREKGTK